MHIASENKKKYLEFKTLLYFKLFSLLGFILKLFLNNISDISLVILCKDLKQAYSFEGSNSYSPSFASKSREQAIPEGVVDLNSSGIRIAVQEGWSAGGPVRFVEVISAHSASRRERVLSPFVEVNGAPWVCLIVEPNRHDSCTVCS